MARIATWNLEANASDEAQRRQQAVLDAAAATVTVLTEVAAGWSSRLGTLVTSPWSEDHRRHWVAIAGTGVEEVSLGTEAHPFEVAARLEMDGQEVLLYSTVLPWSNAVSQVPELAADGETAAAMFERILNLQTDRIEQLRNDHPGAVVIWAGDFNQTLEGPNWGGSVAGRNLLQNALDRLGLQAWNRTLGHAIQGMCAIDLICGPPGLCTRTERFAPLVGTKELSDHAGYVVEIDLSREGSGD